MAQSLRRYLFIAFTVGFSVVLIGCTAAYNARTVDSPDWKHAAVCYIRGPFGRSYGRENRKLIIVSIYALKPNAKESSEKEIREAAASGYWASNPNENGTNTLLFEKQYWVIGSDIAWESVWGTEGDLSITLFDGGPGVSSARKEAPKRFLKIMKYRFDRNDGVYREESAQAQ